MIRHVSLAAVSLGILICVPYNSICISSTLLPFVSGTITETNMVPIKLIMPNVANDEEIPMRSTMSWKHFVTRKASVQLHIAVAALATLFTLFVNNSPTINHGMGPKPMLKITMNITNESRGIQEKFERSCVL